MPKELIRKPRDKPAPYSYAQKPGPKPKGVTDAPKTSAKMATTGTRDNLTLRDWMTIFAFIDSHPDMAQAAVVNHFKSKATGALVFTQSTLSRKLKQREKLEERVQSNPNALSSKRPRVVTRPDIERALVLWVQSMEQKRETINEPMLVEKRKQFEEAFNVPDEQRLAGIGWVPSFCKTYNIMEYRRHREARSVDHKADHEAVVAEQIRLREILAPFAKKDRWNFDESALFAFAPPDRGLATQQSSGEKKSKFRITLGFACNADGSEKSEIIFIGKWKQPQCFGKLSPNARGFDYHHNKAAWMTSEIFEQWIRKFDMKMHRENRHVCLLIDNFQGHDVAYRPTNVQVEFFRPNLTSWVQPLGVGVIRCFKAHYRRSYCQRALDLDEVGEQDIYKLDLLEAMLMARDAWNSVPAMTIEHCWDQTGIQQAPIILQNPAKSTRQPSLDSPVADAWNILEEFATTDMTLSQTEDRLRSVLGDGYVDEEWRPALCAVTAAENDVQAALDSINNLRLAANPGIVVSDEPTARTAQCREVEDDLLKCVAQLTKRNRIHGAPSTLEELVNPAEEQEIGERFREFKSDEDIVDTVRREEAISRGEIVEVESESDDEDDPGHQDDDADMGITEMIALCQRLEKASLKGGTSNSLSYNVSQVLRRFRVELSRVQMQNAKQVTLTSMWGAKT